MRLRTPGFIFSMSGCIGIRVISVLTPPSLSCQLNEAVYIQARERQTHQGARHTYEYLTFLPHQAQAGGTQLHGEALSLLQVLAKG